MAADDFRWEIGRVAYDAMDQTTGGCWARDVPYGVHMGRDSEMRDVAMAVAAQVLRDVRDAIKSQGDEGHRGYFFPVEIEQFAAEHGIDLKGEINGR
jgi:hypothetical protein